MRELFETAIDQAVVRDIPIANSEVTDDCADTPDETELT